MSRQLFTQIVALEKALDVLAKRVTDLETSAETPHFPVVVGEITAEVGGTGASPEMTFKRGPGRPPKSSYGN